MQLWRKRSWIQRIHPYKMSYFCYGFINCKRMERDTNNQCCESSFCNVTHIKGTIVYFIESRSSSRSQQTVSHWPKYWALKNVNNRQKCTRKKILSDTYIKFFLSNSGRLIKKQKLFIFSTILNNFFSKQISQRLW